MKSNSTFCIVVKGKVHEVVDPLEITCVINHSIPMLHDILTHQIAGSFPSNSAVTIQSNLHVATMPKLNERAGA